MGDFIQRQLAGKAIAAIAVMAMSCVLLLATGCTTTSSSSSSEQSTSAPSSASATASSGQDAAEEAAVRVASLKGPTSIGIVNLMSEADEGNTRNAYSFSVSGTADEVLPQLIQGEVDIALIPANAAATVYAKTDGAVSAIDLNTLGVLYVVSGDESITGINDLSGHTVYMTGKGTTPEYVMNYLLTSNGLSDDVTLEFKSEATEVAAALASDPNAIGVLPEPYVTSACLKNAELAPRISLTEAWDELQSEDGSQLVTGVTVARTAFIEEHPEAIDEFLDLHRQSVETALADPATTAELVVDAGIMENAAAAEAAIPRCNLVCITGAEMKSALEGYLQVLFDQDPASIGGSLPADAFYYLA